MKYTPFLGRFPKVDYKIDNSIYGDTESLTNLFFRVDLVRNTINNASAYYIYIINEGDTPEILADKIYGDPGAFWIILYANEIFDPQFDWPLNEDEFAKYMIAKYKRQTQAASIDKIIIHNRGTGYESGYALIYDGHGAGANVSITVDDYDGSIQYANVEYGGSGYFVDDIPTLDTTRLRPNPGVECDLEVVMKEPADLDVLAYVKETIHHYEKLVTRLDSRNVDVIDQNRYIISKDQLSNGVIYLTNVSGSFANSEGAYVPGANNTAAPTDEDASNTINATFSGTVLTWEVTDTNPDYGTSNGRLTLAVTKGNFIQYVDIFGNTSHAHGTIIHTAFNDPNYRLPNDMPVPFEYYNNLPETQAYQSFNIEDYTMTEIYKRYAVSLWDHEYEKNEKKKIIKIIKPQYVARIQSELQKLLEDYQADGSVPIYSYKRRLF